MLSSALVALLLGRSSATTSCDVEYCTECVTDYSDKCKTCQDNYKLDADTGTCVACPSGTWGPRCSTRKCWLTTRTNCLECSRTDRCWRCEDGYYVTWYGGCGACAAGTGGYECQDITCNGVAISNCETCSTAADGGCAVCKDAYRLVAGTNTCEACPDGRIGRECISMKCLATTRDYCLECLSGTDRCNRCYDDFSINWLGKCVQCEGNTGGYNCEKTKCNGKVAENCKTCYSTEDGVLDPGACKVCADGYYKESSSATTCTQCPDNRLSDGVTCNAVSCAGTRQDNCQTCTEGGTTCQLCLDGYSLNGSGSCEACPEGKGGPNCVGSKCTAEQIAAIDDCEFCGDDGACVQCAAGFTLDNGECVPVNGCQTSDCRSCTVTDGRETCKRCSKGYYVVGGKCARCAGNCLDCKSASVCVACEKGYTLTSNVCVSDSPTVDVDSCKIPNCLACLTTDKSVCATCSSGRIWNTNERACVIACPDTNCIDCDSSTGKCRTCGAGYGMQGTTCYPCTLDNCSHCSFHTNAKTGESTEICTQCSSGELTSDGQCKEVVRMSKKTVLISSVGVVALILLACIGVGLFFVFRRKPSRPAQQLGASSSALPVDSVQDVESPVEVDDSFECVETLAS